MQGERSQLDDVDDGIEDVYSENSYDSNDLAEAEVAYGKWTYITHTNELAEQRERVGFPAHKNQRIFVKL